MDLPQRPRRRVAAAVLPVEPFQPTPAASVLAVVERGSDDLHSHGVSEVKVLDRLLAPKQGVEIGAGLLVAGAQPCRRNLRYDAGVPGTIEPISELDVPVAIIFDLLDAPHPALDAVERKLASAAFGAAIAAGERRRLPSAQDDGDCDRQWLERGEGSVGLDAPAVARLAAGRALGAEARRRERE